MSERNNIIQDILNWRIELEVTGGESFDYDEYQQELSEEVDSELEDWWRGTVGEWVASRTDVYETFEDKRDAGEFAGDFEDFVEHQLDLVKAGEETAYGFLNPQ